MWYVIWTSTGSERKTCEAVSSKVKRAFVPTKTVAKKTEGKWSETDKPLFPGYLFADTDDIDSLSAFLWKMEGFGKVLDTEREIYPIYGDEEEFVERLYERGGSFDLSTGYIEGERIVITSGPLKGMEGLIRKIDRHKRTAYLRLSFFEREIMTSVGLEITEKK